MTPPTLALPEGKHWFLDDEPSRRFPLYCRGNVGEIVPEVATPLTSTMSTPAFRKVFRATFSGTGVFSAEELADPSATGGVFGGYLYFNVSLMRTFAARAPGMSPADIDKQLLGRSGDVPTHLPQPGDRAGRRLPLIAVGMVRTMVTRQRADLDAEREETRAWLAALPDSFDDSQLVDLVCDTADRFAEHLTSLLGASMGSGIPLSMLERLAGRAELEEPGVFVKALSGLGTIETARPAVMLWRLGRTVAASPTLTAAFDAGVPGILERLEAGGEHDFLREFEDFLDQFGHRGPNEVELASDTWGTSPETALAAVERLRLGPDSADPSAANQRLAQARAEATERIRLATRAPLRPVVQRLLAAAARGSARREEAKGTLVLGLSGLRRALFAAADRLIAEGHLADRKSLFMVTADELPAFLADPPAFATRIAERRGRYDGLNGKVPPYFFDGVLPDPATWPDRTRERSPRTDENELAGIGVSSGVVSGRARIIVDPGDPRGLEPGEILVAPITDPAWTPLFLAAGGVVVEVGAMQSHAAIVARELGIPAVVSVDRALTQIRDGDEVEVDGTLGKVRITARHDAGS